MYKIYCSESLRSCINTSCLHYLDKKLFDSRNVLELSNLKSRDCDYKEKNNK